MPGLELTSWVRAVLVAFGYPGIAILIILETVFPPIPSEVVLPLAGFLANQGDFHVLLLIVSATCGSVIGALVLYEVGRRVTLGRLEQWFEDYGRYMLTDPQDLNRAEDWFKRHANWAVLIGRLVPGVRSFISIPAGLSNMPLPQFIALTAIGSGIWNTALIGAGWLLGSQWNRVSTYANVVEYVIIAVVLIAIVWFVTSRLRQRRSQEGN